jgi:hypothetical protein
MTCSMQLTEFFVYLREKSKQLNYSAEENNIYMNGKQFDLSISGVILVVSTNFEDVSTSHDSISNINV